MPHDLGDLLGLQQLYSGVVEVLLMIFFQRVDQRRKNRIGQQIVHLIGAVNDAIIEEVLCAGTASIPAADIKIIRMIAKEYVDGIFRRLREHGYDEGTMMLYITGGGGCLVKNFGKVSADRVKFVDDICAAAKGYEYLAEAQLRAEFGL